MNSWLHQKLNLVLLEMLSDIIKLDFKIESQFSNWEKYVFGIKWLCNGIAQLTSKI